MKGFRALMARRDRCYEKARKYLGSGFHLWKTDGDDYPEELAKFKKLFASKDPELITAAWNGINFTSAEQIKRSDFTDDEYAFVLKRVECRKDGVPQNSAEQFTTERLIIKPNADEASKKAYIHHLKCDGDVEKYCSGIFKNHTADFIARNGDFKFWIYGKEEDRLVGMIEFSYVDRERRCAETSWYILKPYRRRGYAEESFCLLARKLFEGKLPERYELTRINTYRRSYPKIDLIRAYVQEDNTPSRALAEACGFKLAYIEKRYFYLDSSKRTKNAAVYELTP
ncbi:MAG: GNAT family N-acetyltransferase [Clostridia bacterium]|nr:GNAT family N-acetyltransferase [Clostridia bacterium]